MPELKTVWGEISTPKPFCPNIRARSWYVIVMST